VDTKVGFKLLNVNAIDIWTYPGLNRIGAQLFENSLFGSLNGPDGSVVVVLKLNDFKAPQPCFTAGG
jgi:hypothetical protein